MRTPAELTDAFRQQGLKVTPQRQLLFRLLHGNERHPSAEALHAIAVEMMPGISLRTVYQTLTDLAAMGELQVLSLTPGAQRFDPNTSDHHHAQCRQCGQLRDIYVGRIPELEVRGLEGFQVDTTTILVAGLCTTCAADPSPTIPHQQQGARP